MTEHTDTAIRARGFCRVCSTRQRLDADGRLMAHPFPVQLAAADPADYETCGGTGYLPADPR